LKTAATVPQIADAFAIVYGALNAAGVKASNSEVIQLTTRLTQAANAMKVPMEQIRQEINSLLTGQITEDSQIAKRLGLDNAAIKQMQANGTLVAEIMRKAEGYALAAEAQSNTVRGKLVNTTEVVIATLSRAFDPVIQKSKGALDSIFSFFATHGDAITTFVQRAFAGVELAVTAVSKWISENRSLVEEILAFGAVAAAAAAAYGVIAVAIAAVTSPIALVIGGVVGLAVLWEKTRKYSEIEVGGRPIAAYVRATFEFVTGVVATNVRTSIGILKGLWEAISAGVTSSFAFWRMFAEVVQVPGKVLGSLAAVAVETVQKIGRAFAPIVDFVAQPVSRVVRLIVGLGAAFRSLIGAAEGPARRVGEVFQSLVSWVTAPLRQLLQLIAQLPAKLIAIIPGADAVRDAARDFLATLPAFAKPAETIATTLSDAAQRTRETATDMRAALDSKGGLGSVADLVRDTWGEAKGWLNAQLPELTALGKKGVAALGLTAVSTVTPHIDAQAATRAQKALEQLQNDKDAYFRLVADYRAEAEAAGDPLGHALRKIDAERAIALAKLQEQKAKLKDVISADVFAADERAINASFDAKAIEARRNADASINAEVAATLRLQKELTLAAQRETEDQRIALIKNSAQRELRERLAANERWFEDEAKRVEESIKNEHERANQIALLDEERQRRNERDLAEADRAMREATFGYAQYWQKLADTIAAQWRDIGTIISDTIVESRRELAGAVNGFLDDLTSGQTDLLKSISGLAKGLSSLWTKALTDILMSGKNVAKQLQELFASIHVQNPDGTTDYAGTFTAGAGFGGMVGGIFAGPNNYAMEGGAIGGGVGAVIGAAIAAYFTWGAGTGAGAQIGAAIGTVIGTVIGSFIQKGTDSIEVDIVEGVATVTEKGISAKARQEVQTQIQRRVKEEGKAWQSILDLFPQTVRDQIKNLVRPVNVSGGVEDADISDNGALDALAHFLDHDLPEATFNAYWNAISTGLRAMGVNSERLGQLFTYFGTLQGNELKEAVERYVRVVLDTADIRGKLDAPFADKVKAASEYGQQKPLQRLDDISAAIDSAVERMAGLTDIEDIVATQEEINALARQYYETQLQYLARIQQIQQNITNSIAQQREQIELAGKDDQGKVDFFFQRMLELRGQLANSTDPEEIGRLVQQIQQYVSMALGIAPDSPEMRQKLLDILGDVEGLSESQLAKATAAVEERDAKPASALERAAELLMQAAEDLSGSNDDDDDEDEDDDGTPTLPPPEIPRRGQRFRIAGLSNVTEEGGSLADRLSRLDDVMVHRAPAETEDAARIADLLERINDVQVHRAAEKDTRAEELIAQIREAHKEPAAPNLTVEDIAQAMKLAMDGLELATTDTIIVDNGELGEQLLQTAERRVITRIKDDPYSILPRAA
jgi:hypothetical protein